MLFYAPKVKLSTTVQAAKVLYRRATRIGDRHFVAAVAQSQVSWGHRRPGLGNLRFNKGENEASATVVAVLLGQMSRLDRYLSTMLSELILTYQEREKRFRRWSHWAMIAVPYQRIDSVFENNGTVTYTKLPYVLDTYTNAANMLSLLSLAKLTSF